MLKVRKVGKWYRIEGHLGGQRIRLALRSTNRDNAHRTIGDVEMAIVDGANSGLWPKLQVLLPKKSFATLAAIAGYVEEPSAPCLCWAELLRLFEADCIRRLALKKMSASTIQRYKFETREFSDFLKEIGIDSIDSVDRPIVEKFKVWRVERIRSRSGLKGAKSLSLSAAILHRVFAFAIENEMLVKNPVRLEGRPGAEPERGSQPFRPDEILKLREHAGPDLLAFSLLRWTGFRGSDAVALTWAEVDLEGGEIIRITQKRGKKVVLPIHTELIFHLEAEFERRKPNPWERVLLNPETGKPFTRPRLYYRMKAMGRRAGVANSNPHRFRDSLAVELLSRGATPYDVAKMLGDTIQTVEQHYAPFVHELRERVRRILESEGPGTGTIWARSSPKTSQVQ